MIVEQAFGDRYSYTMANSIDQVSHLWELIPTSGALLSANYLRGLELAPPPDMTFYYLLIYDQGKLLGKAYLQYKRFVTSDSLKPTDTDTGVYCILGKIFKDMLGKIEVKLLVLGNLLLTGQHGFAFIEGSTDRQEFRSVLLEIVTSFPKSKIEGMPKFDVLLSKDFDEDDRIASNSEIYEFCVEPAMELEIREHWQTMDDYMDDLSSKYRIKFKNVRKKRGDLIKRLLTTEEIGQYQDRLYELYKNIAKQVVFNIVNLDSKYFYDLKRSMGDQYQIVGYFDGEELIAFYSYIEDGDFLEAYYVGFLSEYIKENKIYSNILYDYVETAILKGKTKLALSRTAAEIKSSLGAEPIIKYCYLRHNRRLGRIILPTVMKYFTPQKEWTQRRPFKK